MTIRNGEKKQEQLGTRYFVLSLSLKAEAVTMQVPGEVREFLGAHTSILVRQSLGQGNRWVG